MILQAIIFSTEMAEYGQRPLHAALLDMYL